MLAVHDVCEPMVLETVVHVVAVPAASVEAMWYPVLPLDVRPMLIATVYAAPAAGVLVLGVAVTAPDATPLWQFVQTVVLEGVAPAGPATATRRAAATIATAIRTGTWRILIRR